MRTSASSVDLVDMARRIMVDHNFDINLDACDRQELDGITAAMRDSEGRKDLRSLLWSSIDNHDSKDLDQVEYIEQLDQDRIRLYIGIADVDACVPQGQQIDKFAGTNSTSVYTGVRVFPMLPEELSNERTSLLPKMDREAMVMQLDVDGQGAVIEFQVYFAIVRNYAKLAYEKVARWLEGSPYPELDAVPGLAEQVRLQEKLCLKLRSANERAGAISVQTVEAQPVAVGGVVVDLQLTQSNRARDIIQSFMVAANSSLAHYMQERKVAIIQRIVKKPSRWPKLVTMAASFGTTLPPEPDAVALAKFISSRRAADSVNFPEFSLTVIKLLGPGQYVVHVPGQPAEGHFGLAVHEYTHATAPNRRYADLVLQRIVKALIRGKAQPYTVEDLSAIAEKCMDRENAARKVERIMRKAAAAILLAPRVGETFDAIVTGSSDKGVYVRLLAPPAEGRVISNHRGLDVGDSVRVRLLFTNYHKGFIDFERVN